MEKKKIRIKKKVRVPVERFTEKDWRHFYGQYTEEERRNIEKYGTPTGD